MNGAINGGSGAGNGVDNQGTVNVTGALSVNGYAVSNEGTISGGSVSIANNANNFSNSFINGNGGTISGITLSFSGGGNFINNGSISETSSLYVNNANNIANTGLISANSIRFFSNGATPLSNSGTISGSSITIFSGMTNTGTIATSGGSSTIQSHSSFDNENVISATNGETLDLNANGVNNGTISVGGAGSRLVFNNYSLGGSGQMLINNGGTLEVAGGTLSDGVTFASGAVGTLQLDGPNLLTGTISGLAVGDVIAFAHATVTNAVVNGTTLAVTFQGGATENFTLAGPLPAGDYFSPQLDGAGGTELVVTPTTLPTVSSITASGTGITNGKGDLNAGHVITLTVTFSDVVAVNTAGGTPTLGLNDGGTATYTGGSGTNALTFSYTVASGQNAANLAVNGVSLNGAIIPADLSGAAATFNGLQIDTTPPLAPTIADSAVHNGYVNLANDTSGQALTGTAEPGSTVKVYLNGASTPYTAITDGSGIITGA
jgi:hypothetical protein